MNNDNDEGKVNKSCDDPQKILMGSGPAAENNKDGDEFSPVMSRKKREMGKWMQKNEMNGYIPPM